MIKLICSFSGWCEIDVNDVLLTDPHLEIIRIQNLFIRHGFQFVEHIFNDDNNHNCFVQMTREKRYDALTPGTWAKDIVGWGRFPRIQAWMMAEEWLQRQPYYTST